MAHVSSMKLICEKIDNRCFQDTKSELRAPVNRNFDPEIKLERNCSSKEKLQRARNMSINDDASEDGLSNEVFTNFDAIPDEFRPTKQGKNLLKVRTSPKKNDLNGEPQQKERFQKIPSELQRKKSSSDSNSPTVLSESRSCKKESLCEHFEQPQQDNDLISCETGKQKNPNSMFFYNSSFENGSTAKAAKEHQQSWSRKNNNLAEFSEKSKGKKTSNESTQNKFFNSNGSHSKRTYGFDVRSNFPQNKDDIKFLKNIKNSLPNSTASSQKIDSFIEKGIQKITIEKTVTKRIQWNSDLCRFKKPENKPNVLYKYTKNTKQSATCVSFHNEENDEITKETNQNFKKGGFFSQDEENDEITEKPDQNLKKERFFCQDYRHSRSMYHNNDEPKRRFENRKYKRFDSTNMPERKEKKQFVPERSQKPANEFREKRNYPQYSKGKDPIIIRHEIKIFHMNGQGKNNRKFNNSFQTFRPHNKSRNNRIINSGDRHGYETGKNTMTKPTEATQKIRNSGKPSMESSDSSLKSEYIHNAVSLTSDNDFTNTTVALFECGREISDLIVGSSLGVSVFLDNFEQWKDFRRVTMFLFEEFEKNLSQSCNKNQRIVEVAGMVGSGCKLIQFVPHFGVSVAAKIIACLSDVFVRIFSSSKSAKSIDMDDFQLKKCLQRDVEATSDVYLHGLQCDLQFQETCKAIEEFHKKIKDGIFEKFVETFETGFLKEISLLNPKHPEVFYKRLERFYKQLYDQRQSEEGEAFCRVFEDWPDALTNISCLPRRFKTDNWDSSPVLKTWEEIYNLLQNDQSVVEDVLKKIQDCICVLMREQSVIEKYVRDLQRRS